MTPARLPDWPERLAAMLERARTARFEWGVCDCVTFAAAAVLASTGRDVLAPWRGGWRDARGAVQMLQRHGGLHAAACSVLGPAQRMPALARRGDILLMDAQSDKLLAVADGHRAWAPSRVGLLELPLSWAVAFWPVGWRDA